MNLVKKLLTIVIALVMMLGLGVTAMADDEPAKNDSITVKNAKPGETYNIYKLFDLSVNDENDPTAYTYTVNAEWEAFFGEGGAGADYVTINEAGAVTAINDAAALAKAAAEWDEKPEAKKSEKVAEGASTVEFSNLEDGYWLITSTLGTIAMAETTPDKDAVEIDEKNSVDTIEKKVKEDSTKVYGTSNSAQIGDTVEFQSTIKLVKGTRNVVVHDKMDSGLTYTAGSVDIEELTKETEYTVNESPADGDTFDITFNQSWIDELDFGNEGYKEYVITYTATLNEKAVVKDENGTAVVNQENKTHVSFGDGTTSVESTTTTATHKFSIFKHATGKTENLAGAVFSLKKAGTVVPLIKLDDQNYRVAMSEEAGAVDTFTTVADGDIVIWGVDADSDYTLEEITPPEGYNKLTEAVSVPVESGDGTRITVENKFGSELPSTGGMGTTLFYIAGTILVAAAGILLVSRRRMSE